MNPTRHARSHGFTSDGLHSGSGPWYCCGAAPAPRAIASMPSVNSIAARNPFFIESPRPEPRLHASKPDAQYRALDHGSITSANSWSRWVMATGNVRQFLHGVLESPNGF